MIPKITFRVSWVHNLMFDKNRYIPKEKRTNKKYSALDGNDLLGKSSKFKDSFNKNSRKILSLIEYKTGFDWVDKEIIVYISDTVPNSYEDPMTLKYQESVPCMLLVMIHELIHRNIPRKLQDSVSDKERETWVEVITKEVCDELNIKCIEYPGFRLREINKFSKEKNLTLKAYLERNGSKHNIL